MSNFEVKTQVKAKDDIYLIEGRPFKDGRIQGTSEPIGAAFTTAGLPDPAGLDDGLIAYDSDRKALVVTLSGAWVVA